MYFACCFTQVTVTELMSTLETFDFGTLLSGDLLGAGLGLWSKYLTFSYFK